MLVFCLQPPVASLLAPRATSLLHRPPLRSLALGSSSRCCRPSAPLTHRAMPRGGKTCFLLALSSKSKKKKKAHLLIWLILTFKCFWNIIGNMFIFLFRGTSGEKIKTAFGSDCSKGSESSLAQKFKKYTLHSADSHFLSFLVTCADTQSVMRDTKQTKSEVMNYFSRWAETSQSPKCAHENISKSRNYLASNSWCKFLFFHLGSDNEVLISELEADRSDFYFWSKEATRRVLHLESGQNFLS